MEDFIKIAVTSEIPPGGMKGFVVGKEKILVANLGGKFYATSSVCTHVGGPLEKGSLKDGVVTCPWHHSEFDVMSGKVVNGPAKESVKKFELKVEGDQILVKV